MSRVLALHDRKGILVIYLHNTRKLDIMYLSIQMTFINMYGNEKKFFVHFLFECMHPVFFRWAAYKANVRVLFAGWFALSDETKILNKTKNETKTSQLSWWQNMTVMQDKTKNLITRWR